MAKNTMSAMGTAGDTKIEWAPDNEDEVQVAERTFDDLTKKGFKAFRVLSKGKRGQEIETFDPQAERIVLIPPMAGG